MLLALKLTRLAMLWCVNTALIIGYMDCSLTSNFLFTSRIKKKIGFKLGFSKRLKQLEIGLVIV